MAVRKWRQGRGSSDLQHTCKLVQRSRGSSDASILQRARLPSSRDTSSIEVTDILCEATVGDLGASPSADSAAVPAAAGVSSVFCSSASGTGSLTSSAPSEFGISGTWGTSASKVCSGAADDDDSRRLISEREREADVGRGVVSVASSKASCRQHGSAGD